jgi:hypothetical protein
MLLKSLRPSNLIRKTKLALSIFHENQRGDLVQDVLRIAVIALPILIVLYIIICALSGNIEKGLKDLGIDVTGKLDKFCIF